MKILSKVRSVPILIALLMIFLFVAGCSNGESNETAYAGKIIFSDVGWDSIKFHNAVAGFIAETAFNLEWEEINGTTPVMMEALKKGDIDVQMETWTSNLPNYEEDKEAGHFIEAGLNFADNAQGFYVPRYVIEGDPVRGIEPSAPDLRHVKDLAK